MGSRKSPPGGGQSLVQSRHPCALILCSLPDKTHGSFSNKFETQWILFVFLHVSNSKLSVHLVCLEQGGLSKLRKDSDYLCVLLLKNRHATWDRGYDHEYNIFLTCSNRTRSGFRSLHYVRIQRRNSRGKCFIRESSIHDSFTKAQGKGCVRE
jgi:hypothetical protein